MANLNLFEAVKQCDLDRTRFLIESGMLNANTNILEKDKYGWTALHHAPIKGNLEIVKLLVESMYNINESGMSNLNTNVLEKTLDGFTALHIASRFKNLEIVKFLIQSGSDLSEKSNEGWTPLYFASYWGNFEVVKLLVESGSHIDIEDNNGKTPIDLAETEEIKEFLIEQLEIQQNSYVLK